MTEQFVQIRDMLTQMATDTLGAVIAYLPNLIGGLVVLLIGWLFARLISSILERSIRGGLEGILERTGVTQALERVAMTATPSQIVGRVFYWLIMILVIMAASEVLRLEEVSSAITTILGYIPAVVSAALILAAGIFLARFVANLVESGASAAGLSYARGLGAVARVSLIIMVGVVTLEQLGVDTQILVTVITVTVAAIVAGIGLAFALGARNTVSGILAGHYLRQQLVTGQSVEIAGERGTVEAIGPMSTRFSDGDRTWNVPNTRLIDEVIRS